MFMFASVLFSGYSGCSAYHFAPNKPFSSPVTATKISDRGGGVGSALYAFASVSSAPTPVALSSAPLKIWSPLSVGSLPRWSQCAVYTMYSFLRFGSAPSSFAITFFDWISRTSFRTWNVAFAFSATGLKSLRVAALWSESKFRPALRNSSFVLSSVIHDSTATRFVGPVALLSKFSRPQLPTTTSYGYPAGPVSCTMIAAAAPLSDAISYLYVQRP